MTFTSETLALLEANARATKECSNALSGAAAVGDRRAEKKLLVRMAELGFERAHIAGASDAEIDTIRAKLDAEFGDESDVT
jgi:hypothetical protein